MDAADRLVRVKREADWRDGTNPYVMLHELHREWYEGRVGHPKRRLRLFACACCRRIWHLLDEGRGRRAVILR